MGYFIWEQAYDLSCSIYPNTKRSRCAHVEGRLRKLEYLPSMLRYLTPIKFSDGLKVWLQVKWH